MADSHQVFWGDARAMGDLKDASVHLVVTSPPYWQLKDYGSDAQIGFNQSLDEYFESLAQVWRECYRVLHPGCRMCINVGDQFARAAHYGRYKVIPLHAQIIADAERAGFDFMGQIIWQKVTTQNASGGGAIMGSFPYPRNGIVKLDSEYILLFKKLGDAPKPTPEQKTKSVISVEEWNRFFAGHWNFAGEKQGDGHIAMFPTELPRRLIRMFCFHGETVLDPFLGAGTTLKAAMECGRKGIGYEINRDFKGAICARLGLDSPSLWGENVEFSNSNSALDIEKNTALPEKFARRIDPKAARFDSVISLQDHEVPRPNSLRVREIIDGQRLLLSNGCEVVLRGIQALENDEMGAALQKLTRNRAILLREELTLQNGLVEAYVYLDNKTFLNAKLLRLRVATPGGQAHRLSARFEKIAAGEISDSHV